MLEAAAWGLVGASSLLIGAIMGAVGSFSDRVVGLVLAFGAGTLISAVAFELTEEAFQLGGADAVVIGLAAGAIAYYLGSVAIARRGGGRRMAASGRDDDESSAALLLGAILDGIPESAVIGITVLEGQVGVPILAAVFLSNLPEAFSSSKGMCDQGVGLRRVLERWALVVVACGISAGVGYGALEHASDNTIALIQAFAGGAVLTMLADTMIPEAYTHGMQRDAPRPWLDKAVGLATVLGFALAYLLSTLD